MRNCHQDKNRQEMISNMISFARKNQSLVIAGGSMPWEMETVIRLGVDYLQGFYLGVPSLIPQPVSQEAAREILDLNR